MVEHKNGKLLELAIGAGFEIFITTDRNLQDQQNLRSNRISVILLLANSNRIDDRKSLVREVLNVMKQIKLGQVVEVKS